MNTKDYLSKVLLTYDQIIKRINELAIELNNSYMDEEDEVLIVPVMDGSLMFASHLILNLNFPLKVQSTKISSYDENITSSLDPKFICNIPTEKIKGRKILIIEDLVDTGTTLNRMHDFLIANGASDVKICVLFNKDIPNRQLNFNIDFQGFDIPNEWVAGFGVDSQGYFRNLKDFGIVNKKYIKTE